MKKIKIDNYVTQSKSFLYATPSLLWVILIAITFFLTIANFSDQDNISFSYYIGDVAKRDIKAPQNFFIEDKEATALKKNQAKDGARIVYDLDENLLKEIHVKINKSFDIPRKLFSPSKDSQGNIINQPEPTFAMAINTKKQFEETLGVPVSKGAYAILYKNRFALEIPEKIKTILTKILTNGMVANKEILLKESSKGILLRSIGSSKERIVNNLKVFYGPDQGKAMVRIEGQPILKNVNYNLSNLIVDISQRLLLPNITMNKNETEKRIKEEQSLIKPVLYKIKAGEMILREGERVDKIKLMKLKALQEQFKPKNVFISSIGKALIIFFSILITYLLFLKNHVAIKNEHNKHVLFLALGLSLYLIIAILVTPIAQSASIDLPWNIDPSSIFMILPIPAAAITVCLFLGFDVALFFSIVISLLAAINFPNSFEVFIYFFLSCITAAFWIKEKQKRRNFIIAGFKIAVFNVFIACSLSLYSLNQLDFSILGNRAIFAFIGGILSSVFATGFIPLIEFIFNYTTEYKLLEFSNLDQPIIKKLMIEAPGTYNHSIIVATLAEAAASAINANNLMAKVCGYYHDIGKLDKTLYFIENQAGGKNKHDKLSPSMSALVLIQHVKKGVELAKKHKLGKEIVEGIQQHHGTSLIKYFYQKSLNSGNDTVKEDDFRYPGPKPQTREAGIVMLADVVEAAVRALERPTPSRIQGRVKELINDIFADGQLEECELTLKDLHEIAKSFNNILTSIYHNRIEYTDKSQEKKRDRNENPKDPDRQQAGKDSNNRQNSQKDRTDLKRLGI